jgi:signal transduction histidine kinase
MERRARTHSLPLGLACVAVMASILGASALTHHAAKHIDEISDGIAYNAAPSIEHLAGVRTELVALQLLVSEHLRARAANLEGVRERVDAAARRLDEEMRAYLELPAFPGERVLRGELGNGLRELLLEVERVLAVADGGAPAAAQADLDERFRPAARRLLDSVVQVIDFNARVAQDLAVEIKQVRRHVTWLGYALDLFCAAVFVLAVVFVRRSVQRHEALLEAHSRFQEQRAAELEMFSGRVAHDIMNPLGAARMSLDLALRRGGDDAKTPELLERSVRSLRRWRSSCRACSSSRAPGRSPRPGRRPTWRK